MVKSVTALLPEGELAKRAQKHNIDWPEITFFAEGEGEPFTDVEIITLQQHCIDNIIPDAIEYCSNQNIRGDQETLIAKYIATHNEEQPLREFVATTTSPWEQKIFVTVGVNRSVIDDEAVDYALTLLEKVHTFDNGDFVEFGSAMMFTPLVEQQ